MHAAPPKAACAQCLGRQRGSARDVPKPPPQAPCGCRARPCASRRPAAAAAARRCRRAACRGWSSGSAARCSSRASTPRRRRWVCERLTPCARAIVRRLGFSVALCRTVVLSHVVVSPSVGTRPSCVAPHRLGCGASAVAARRPAVGPATPLRHLDSHCNPAVQVVGLLMVVEEAVAAVRGSAELRVRVAAGSGGRSAGRTALCSCQAAGRVGCAPGSLIRNKQRVSLTDAVQQVLLGRVLAVGNTLNDGTARGGAAGALLRLARMRRWGGAPATRGPGVPAHAAACGRQRTQSPPCTPCPQASSWTSCRRCPPSRPPTRGGPASGEGPRAPLPPCAAHGRDGCQAGAAAPLTAPPGWARLPSRSTSLLQVIVAQLQQESRVLPLALEPLLRQAAGVQVRGYTGLEWYREPVQLSELWAWTLRAGLFVEGRGMQRLRVAFMPEPAVTRRVLRCAPAARRAPARLRACAAW
jgi:hypothetical protein